MRDNYVSKLNSTIKFSIKMIVPQSSRIYSKDAKMFQHLYINVIYHTNKRKDKNCKIFSIGVGKKAPSIFKSKPQQSGKRKDIKNAKEEIKLAV